jgi:hypothetical protein
MFDALREAGLSADQDRVREKVERAVRQYYADTPPNSQRPAAWQRFADQNATAKQLARRLTRLAQADQADLLHLAGEISRLQSLARSRVERYRHARRLMRLFSAFCQVWIDEGGALIIAEQGPLLNFLSAALAPIHSLSHDSLKVYLRAERRRRILFRGTGRLAVRAEVIRG